MTQRKREDIQKALQKKDFIYPPMIITSLYISTFQAIKPADASQVRMENELTEKVRALFDAREVS